MSERREQAAPPTSASHWEEVHSTKDPRAASWYQPEPLLSLELIAEADLAPDDPILDLGAGTSPLAARLLDAGHTDITAADISAAALARARAALGPRAEGIAWLELDVRVDPLPRRYALWHDRAVFHFMVDEDDRDRYLASLRRGLRPGGHLVLATFGPEGPERCSGLPVHRYGLEELRETLGPGFELASSRLEDHHTPGGNTQQFLWAHLRRAEEGGEADAGGR